ncbi:hypothetical protein E2C01_083437 [Portunus trituberculatus]|uniref:Uncharacterized protein n=1 Tax=Portunus trituberculatus TaxID=210409 RepID=A0A5B7IV61_PORTR|nr:hypothetical protein [Portunus trituberculatus]
MDAPIESLIKGHGVISSLRVKGTRHDLPFPWDLSLGASPSNPTLSMPPFSTPFSSLHLRILVIPKPWNSVASELVLVE